MCPVQNGKVGEGTATANIAENANTGSFTKKGAGDFTLRCANTWGGDTILEGGELVLGAVGALPVGSKIVYRGGTLKSSAAASPRPETDTKGGRSASSPTGRNFSGSDS